MSSSKQSELSEDLDNIDQQVSQRNQEQEVNGNKEEKRILLNENLVNILVDQNQNNHKEDLSQSLDIKEYETNNRATVCQFSIDESQGKPTIQNFSGMENDEQSKNKCAINPFEDTKDEVTQSSSRNQSKKIHKNLPVLLAGESLSKDTYDLERIMDKNVQKRITVSGNRFDYAPNKSTGLMNFTGRNKNQNERNFIKQNVNMVSQSRNLSSPRDSQYMSLQMTPNHRSRTRNRSEKNSSPALKMVQRLYQYKKLVEEKTKQKEDEINKKRQEECTFMPKTQTNYQNLRSFDTFFQSQEKHIQQK